MMRLRLLLAAAVILAAGETVAQVVNHDLPVQAIMATGVNPGALAFWAGGNDPPEGETKAGADARWAAAVQGAQTMQVKGRELMQHSRPGRWNEFAQMLVDGAVEGEAAAKAQDAAKAFEIGGGPIYNACNGCHKTYIPSPKRLP
jgi:cytochrome c556